MTEVVRGHVIARLSVAFCALRIVHHVFKSFSARDVFAAWSSEDVAPRLPLRSRKDGTKRWGVCMVRYCFIGHCYIGIFAWCGYFMFAKYPILLIDRIPLECRVLHLSEDVAWDTVLQKC